MRGHEGIIRMRQERIKPDYIFIDDFPTITDWEKWGDIPTVCTAGDSMENIDLRFVIGCKVNITSSSEYRAKALFALCKNAGAQLVSAGVVQVDKHPCDQSGWCQVWEK